MPRCLVPGCESGSVKPYDRSHILHGFPKDVDMQNTWLALCRSEIRSNIENGRVCSKHFLDEDYERDLMFELLNISKTVRENIHRRLKPFAVPSLYMPLAQTSRWVFFGEFSIITHVFDVLILYFIEQGIRKDATFQGPSRLRALDMFVSDTVPPCTLHICYPLQSATCPREQWQGLPPTQLWQNLALAARAQTCRIG